MLNYNGGPTRIGIGSTGYALAVQSNGLPGYEIVGNQTRIYYVDSEDGVDTNNGLAPNLTFKTIKRLLCCRSPDNNITDFQVYVFPLVLRQSHLLVTDLDNVGTFIQLS